MDIHPAAQAFGSRADDYEKGRPDYPADAVGWLTEALGLANGSTVLDLAAGTGKLARLLLPTGARVVAVEPVQGMRDVLRSVVPEVEVLEGTAEQIPVPDGSADAAAVGQAFHWFRGVEALSEIYRVLVPMGRLGLIWNTRDMAQPLQVELGKIMSRYKDAAPSHGSGEWKKAFDATRLFGPLTLRRFPMRQTLDVDQLVARVLSTSFMAALPGDEQDAVAGEVVQLASQHSKPLVLRYIADVYWCEATDKV